MLLAASFLSEFSRFIQIISWIILPIAAVTVFITIYSHYRKKNKLTALPAGNAGETVMLITQGNSGQKINGADYIYFDHFALINEYEKRLACSHARFSALKNDFLRLKEKYSVLNGSPFLITKNNIGIQYPDVSQQFLQVPDPSKENISAAVELPEQFNELNKINRLLEKENQLLKEQLKLFKATDDEKATIINSWNDQTLSLQNKIEEQGYLHEIVEEKKAYINFLQQQLEQLQKTTEYTQLALNSEVLQKQEEVEKLNAGVLKKEEQLKEEKQLLTSRLDHITYLENVLRETKQQNEILNATLADERKLIASLEEKLESDQSKIKYLEQTLNSNKQMLKRLYKELTSIVGTESPVIELKPVYADNEESEWNESMAQ